MPIVVYIICLWKEVKTGFVLNKNCNVHSLQENLIIEREENSILMFWISILALFFPDECDRWGCFLNKMCLIKAFCQGGINVNGIAVIVFLGEQNFLTDDQCFTGFQ